jgi:hypothetical protein
MESKGGVGITYPMPISTGRGLDGPEILEKVVVMSSPLCIGIRAMSLKYLILYSRAEFIGMTQS